MAELGVNWWLVLCVIAALVTMLIPMKPRLREGIYIAASLGVVLTLLFKPSKYQGQWIPPLIVAGMFLGLLIWHIAEGRRKRT